MAGSKSTGRRRQVRSAASTRRSRSSADSPRPVGRGSPEKSSKADGLELKRFYAVAFGRVLKELRMQHKLDETEAAARAKISRRRWMRREQGLHTPFLDELLHLAEVFQVDPTWLLKRIFKYRQQEARKAR